MNGGLLWRLAGAALVLGAAMGAVKPAPARHRAVRSPWVYYVSSSYYWQEPDPAFDPSRVVRDVWLLNNSIDRAGEQAVPAELKVGPGAFKVRVEVEFTVTGNDRVTGCGAGEIYEYFHSGPARELGSRAIGAAACRLVQSRLAFRHGLLGDGTRLGQRLGIAIYFERWSEADPRVERLAPPPPPQPVWPPVQPPSELVALDIRDWKSFLPPLSALTGPLATGIWIDIEKDGKVSRCKVAQPSGNADFDTAVCAAFSASTQKGNRSYGTWGYPVRVRWDGKQVSLAEIAWPVSPELTGPNELPQGLAPPGALPPNARVGLDLSFDAAGATTHCSVVASAMHDELDLFSCTALGRLVKIKPGHDIFGDPIGGALSIEVDWRARSFHQQDYN